MIDTVISGDLRNANLVEARKIWGGAVVIAESVEAEEVSGGAVVITQEAMIDSVSDGATIFYNTGDVSCRPSGNCYCGITENVDFIVRALQSTPYLEDAYMFAVEKFALEGRRVSELNRQPL